MNRRHLLIFSSVTHHQHEGQILAHGGFVREINTWAELFDEVTVAAILDKGEVKADDIPYKYPNIHFVNISPPISTRGLGLKLKFLSRLPGLLRQSLALVQKNTFVMARGPDAIGFLGFLVGLLKARPRFAKYAGQWTAYEGEPWAYRFQRWIFRTNLFGGPVIVNARPDKKAPHIVSLFNASMSRREWEDALQYIQQRKIEQPYRLLFVGRITPAKGLDTLLKAIASLRDELQIHLDIIGDGSEKAPMEELATELGLNDIVSFCGWMAREEIREFYTQAYCLISASRHQGLDKVIIEGMTYALPIIGTNVSVIPDIINDPECGLIVEANDVAALAQAIRQMLLFQEDAIEMGIRGRNKVSQMLIDDMPRKYQDFLKRHFGLEFHHER